MSKNNVKKYNNYYYFTLFTGIGLIFGIIFDQLSVGVCLGMAIGLSIDNKKKN